MKSINKAPEIWGLKEHILVASVWGRIRSSVLAQACGWESVFLSHTKT